MINITHYEMFLSQVNAWGFLPFSDVFPDIPSLTGLTLPEQWHTGNPDTDPWQWKDRAAAEKQLAFGVILGGEKGFIAPGLYSAFYVLSHPGGHPEEHADSGHFSRLQLQIWEGVASGGGLTTNDIRRLAGVTKKGGASRTDRVVAHLQKEFWVTVAGNRRKTNARGEPYGWPSNLYQTVEAWAPEAWLKEAASLTREEALARVVQAAAVMCPEVTEAQLLKSLKISR